MRYTNAKQCTGITKSGHPCNNHIIDGKYCWLHEPMEYAVDVRKAIVMKVIKCPYCNCIIEMP